MFGPRIGLCYWSPVALYIDPYYFQRLPLRTVRSNLSLSIDPSQIVLKKKNDIFNFPIYFHIHSFEYDNNSMMILHSSNISSYHIEFHVLWDSKKLLFSTKSILSFTIISYVICNVFLVEIQRRLIERLV